MHQPTSGMRHTSTTPLDREACAGAGCCGSERGEGRELTGQANVVCASYFSEGAMLERCGPTRSLLSDATNKTPTTAPPVVMWPLIRARGWPQSMKECCW